jgi:hypothetical protein
MKTLYMETSSLRTLKILPTNPTKLGVREFGVSSVLCSVLFSSLQFWLGSANHGREWDYPVLMTEKVSILLYLFLFRATLNSYYYSAVL